MTSEQVVELVESNREKIGLDKDMLLNDLERAIVEFKSRGLRRRKR